MSALKRRIFVALIVLLSLFTLVFASVYLLVKSPKFHQWIATRLSERIGYQVRIGDLRLGVPFSLSAFGVSIYDRSALLFQGEKLIVTVTPLDFFSRRIHRLQLEKPSFHIDLQELLDSGSKTDVDIAIRYLNIKEGTLVLKTAGGNLDFRSITVDAENLNLGETTGLTLRAELPWLNGQGDFLVQGRPNETKMEIRVRQGRPRLLRRQAGSEDALKIQAVLRGEENRNLQLLASGKLLDFAIGENKITGDFDSRLDLEPTFNNVGFSSNMRLSNLPSKPGSIPFFLLAGPANGHVAGKFFVREKVLALKDLHLESPSGIADGSATLNFNPEALITGGDLRLRKVPLDTLKAILPRPLDSYSYKGLVDADLDMQGHWRSLVIKGVARSPGVQMSSDTLSLAQLSFKIPFEWANSSFYANDVQAQAKTLAIDEKDRVRASAEVVTLDGRFESKVNEPLKIVGRLRLARGRFATSDNSKVGENLALGGNFNLVTDRSNKLTTFAARLAVENGEVLLGKFFGDLTAHKPSFEFGGSYLGNSDEIRLRYGNVSLPAIGNIDFSGSIEGIQQTPTFRLDVRSENVQSAGVFETIQQTFNRSYPILDRLAVGGRLSFSMNARGPWDALSADGSLQLKAADVRAKSDDWQIGPLEIALPFAVHLKAGTAGFPATSARPGTLVVDSARFRAESISSLKTSLSFWNNELRFQQPIRISIFGGTVEIGNLVWKDIINNPKEISFSLETKNLQLQRLTGALAWYRFGGTLSGSIPQVESVANSLRGQGEIQLAVFGGRVRIAKMEVENPFSSLPSIKLDARMEDIRLEQASETFAFGRISGILEGSVNDLIITAGQPAQLSADLHTVEKRGASQWISVEALNKITVLSSGSDAGSLFGGVAGFFENFRYSKLGLKATLKNDKLTLRGIESQDGKEFLVVGSFLPPTVNIISHTQEIAFSELLRRLQRIQNSEKAAKSVK